jgi:hypothetical protein
MHLMKRPQHPVRQVMTHRITHSQQHQAARALMLLLKDR